MDNRRKCNTDSIRDKTWTRKLERSVEKHWTTSFWKKLSFKVDRSFNTWFEERCI